MRGVSRNEVCAATRIGTRFLDALESEQWEVLPGGIFNRGFVRAVARFLGLDEDDLVAEYDLAFSEQQSQISRTGEPSAAAGCETATTAFSSRLALSRCWFYWEWFGPAGDGTRATFHNEPQLMAMVRRR